MYEKDSCLLKYIVYQNTVVYWQVDLKNMKNKRFITVFRSMLGIK